MANRAKDQFLAILGHELRNPLSAITGAVAVLDQIGTETDEARDAREIIRRQSMNLARMVDDLLDVACLSTGKLTLAPKPVDLAEVAERWVAWCAAPAAAAGIKSRFGYSRRG